MDGASAPARHRFSVLRNPRAVAAGRYARTARRCVVVLHRRLLVPCGDRCSVDGGCLEAFKRRRHLWLPAWALLHDAIHGRPSNSSLTAGRFRACGLWQLRGPDHVVPHHSALCALCCCFYLLANAPSRLRRRYCDSKISSVLQELQKVLSHATWRLLGPLSPTSVYNGHVRSLTWHSTALTAVVCAMQVCSSWQARAMYLHRDSGLECGIFSLHDTRMVQMGIGQLQA